MKGRSTFVWRYNISNPGTEPLTAVTVGVSDWKNSEVVNQWNLGNLNLMYFFYNFNFNYLF